MLLWTRDAVVKFEVFERIVVTDNTGQGHRKSTLRVWMSHREEKELHIFTSHAALLLFSWRSITPTILKSLFHGHVNFSDIMINIMIE